LILTKSPKVNTKHLDNSPRGGRDEVHPENETVPLLDVVEGLRQLTMMQKTKKMHLIVSGEIVSHSWQKPRHDGLRRRIEFEGSGVGLWLVRMLL
jgi:hypothetical protein